MKKEVYIKCQNGIDLESAKRDIFFELTDEYEFIDSDEPDFILFGPYGNQVPPKGKYVRIGYFCENMTPDLGSCDWAFGVPLEEEINDHCYKRIQWHGIEPAALVKQEPVDAERIFKGKHAFCNFLYSNHVPYREEFFRQLSKYKKVDAPGRSMNNMPPIDKNSPLSKWETKRQFLAGYKFTIAFENYSYPGYQTEKLYDSMLAESLPIYCGDPQIGTVFNTQSFLNVSEYMGGQDTAFERWLERNCQSQFIDLLPQFYKTPYHRVRRKVKSMGRNLKMKLQLKNLDFSPLIDRIIELDNNPELYMEYLRQPWFHDNRIPGSVSLKEQWKKIFG